MAELLDQSKTEEPTERRREEAREQGTVAFSAELSHHLVFLAIVLLLLFGSGWMGNRLFEAVRQGLTHSGRTALGSDDASEICTSLILQGLEILAPLFGLAVVIGLGASVFQVGFRFTPSLVEFRPERLDLAAGLQRMFSPMNGWKGLLAVAKLLVIGGVACAALWGKMHQLTSLDRQSLFTSIVLTWALATRLCLAVGATLVLMGVADYFIQWLRVQNSLRMSRQELKEEMKKEEGDPQIKARIRKRARELSQRRMIQEVPRATVVITNPTHLAIALRYDRHTMTAPQVIARGAGNAALKIADTARRHAVPVVERQPLARALFRSVKVGQQIPAVLFRAVAEVLGYIHRLRQGQASNSMPA